MQSVVKSLSESYRGYAQMCNLMCNWLKLAGVDDQTVNKLIVDKLKSIIMEKFDPKQADTIFGEGAVCMITPQGYVITHISL